ncbi:MAG: IS66 family transposase [Phycisphaerae bacterium]|jgi:hypothetical protein
MKVRTVPLPPPAELETFLVELKDLVPERLFAIAQALVAAVELLYQILEKKRYALAALRRLLFGSPTEKTANVGKGNQAPADGKGSKGEPGAKGSKTRKGKGHGRRKLREGFPGAHRIVVPHPEMAPKCPCPNCADGKMYQLKRTCLHPRFFGQPFLVMFLWELEGWRCSSCQGVVWAPLPAEARGPKYDPTAKSMLAVMQYRNGMPFHCIQQHQEAQGIPVSQGVQWQLVSELARDAAPVHEALRRTAARGEVLHNDDTRGRILELAKATAPHQPSPDSPKKGKKPRTGIFTTAIVSRCGDQTIALYCTGRQHAGENLDDLGRGRPSDLPAPIQMCDGLEHNAPAGFKTLLANCLSHARRKIVDIVSFFEQECLHVLEVLKEVYVVDAAAREQALSADERLKLHQEKSAPLLENLRLWMNAQFLEKKVEPNSGLGKAFNYFLKRWGRLTLFLRVPGVPLDNNICERAIKMAVRHRKNSLFYKTQRGAAVGDCLMSLIHTCELAGANAFDYLTALQRHHDAVTAKPEAWLPWNYKTALAVTTASTGPPRKPIPPYLNDCPVLSLAGQPVAAALLRANARPTAPLLLTYPAST